jgi:hypothetical protein
MCVPRALLDELVSAHGLVQAATDEDRAAYHVPNPSGRRKAVLTDIRDRGDGCVVGYLWLTSLPGRGKALLERRPDLVPVGTDDRCVRIEDIGPDELPALVQQVVDYLT